MSALILVDLQNDFMPGGALAVKGGDEVTPRIQELLQGSFDHRVATKDWHPADHMSFAVNHRKMPGETIMDQGVEQILWPVHCLQGSQGAAFYPGWESSQVQKIFYKGTDRSVDSYSCFFDMHRHKSTGLEDYLKRHRVRYLTIAGLATDYCVLYSALDARELGFEVKVDLKGCRGVELHPGDVAQAIQKMREVGVEI